jgi:hypothetical protein
MIWKVAQVVIGAIIGGLLAVLFLSWVITKEQRRVHDLGRPDQWTLYAVFGGPGGSVTHLKAPGYKDYEECALAGAFVAANKGDRIVVPTMFCFPGSFK